MRIRNLIFRFYFLSLVIIRRTQKGEEIYHRWKNYRTVLKTLQTTLLNRTSWTSILSTPYIGSGEKTDRGIFSHSNQTVNRPLQGLFTAIASTFSTLSATGAASAGGVAGGTGASAGAAGGGMQVVRVNRIKYLD